jgi:hypothetical protein
MVFSYLFYIQKKNKSYFENSFGEAKNNYIFAAAYGV